MNKHLQDLLQRTSRTFALTIPLLPAALAHQVGAAYLLFRIADTVEDESRWARDSRVSALRQLAEALRSPELEKVAALLSRLSKLPPPRDAACAELLGALPEVIDAMTPDSPAGDCIMAHVRRTTLGMADSVASADAGGRLAIVDLSGLQRYCYYVAGIVGELLTELFVLDDPRLEAVVGQLRALAAAFGEGLQLVNILKDRDADALENRSFLPAGLPLSELFALAKSNLARGRQYVETLMRAGAARGVVAFTALPVLLAEEALYVVEVHGSGAKVSRARMAEIVAGMHEHLQSGALPAATAQTA